VDIDLAPAALQKRLGPDGMAGLGELFIDARKECTADVIGVVTDRFERRLTDETSKLRLDIAGLRQDMAAGFAALRQEMADLRFELLKWTFLFWVGQFFAVAGLVAVLIRFLRPGI
jgi:hypothetical protein